MIHSYSISIVLIRIQSKAKVKFKEFVNPIKCFIIKASLILSLKIKAIVNSC